MKKLKRFSRSFSLIEAVIACGILMMASAATAAVAVVSIHGSVVNKHKAQATMLAQDVISQFIMQRETNYQSNVNWDDGFNGPTLKTKFDNYCVFYKFTDSTLLSGVFDNLCSTLAPDYLKFQRTVTLDKMQFCESYPPCVDPSCSGAFPNPFKCVGNTVLNPDFSNKTYKLTIIVTWSDYGQTQSVKIITLLTDYKPKY